MLFSWTLFLIGPEARRGAGPPSRSQPGVVPIGQDTYMVSRQAATGFSGSGTRKAEAFREANEFCISQGEVMQRG